MRVITSSMVVLALVTGLGAIYTFRHLNANLNIRDLTGLLGDRPDKVAVDGPREPLTVLALGSDARDGDGNNIDGLTGGGERSDTAILVHLSADRTRAFGVSIPRDSMVERPECRREDGTVIPASSGLEMFNNAYTVGGPACTIATVEHNTDVRIDHFVVVDFRGFVDMVDAIGGVEVCIPFDAIDPRHGIALKAGTREVRGREALNYVRERHKLSPNGDIGRMKRQQAFISSMANKVVSAGTLARPERLFKFLDAATKSLTLDPGLGSLTKLAELGLEVRGIGLENVSFITVPMELWSVNRNRVIWTEDAELVWEAMRNDTPLPRALTRERLTPAKPPGSSAPAEADATGTPSPTVTPTPTPTAGATQATDPAQVEEEFDEVSPEELARRYGLCA
ncbi:LCP family protein [Nocardioides limicola]|uniref:LCP family protein n=1 Tax=Nocardioides limicola TaxID=2803368 RepID=UPI00193B5ECE|nr:LCP family protein [Nocardioides sp. DJM-14]